jgi:hypothetical protein
MVTPKMRQPALPHQIQVLFNCPFPVTHRQVFPLRCTRLSSTWRDLHRQRCHPGKESIAVGAVFASTRNSPHSRARRSQLFYACFVEDNTLKICDISFTVPFDDHYVVNPTNPSVPFESGVEPLIAVHCTVQQLNTVQLAILRQPSR